MIKTKKYKRPVSILSMSAPTTQPGNNYCWVVIPYTAIELRNSRNGRKAHLQLMRKDNLVLTA